MSHIPHADAAQVEAWRTRLAALNRQGPRIGSGSGWASPRTPARQRGDRSPPLDGTGIGWRPSWAIRLACISSACKRDGPAAPEQFPLTDFMGEIRDFADTAALVANLDLIISVDTSVVHLAGALGKPGAGRWTVSTRAGAVRIGRRRTVAGIRGCASTGSRAPATGDQSSLRPPMTCAACRLSDVHPPANHWRSRSSEVPRRWGRRGSGVRSAGQRGSAPGRGEPSFGLFRELEAADA